MRALFFTLLLAACASQRGALDLPESRVALRLHDLEGNTVNLAAFRGRVVLVTIMTTWSDFALLEVPRFKALAEKHGDDLAIISVALDEDPRMVQIFRDTFEIPYVVAMTSDAAKLTSEDGPFGPITIMPTSVLIDREGRVVLRNDGTWPLNVLEQAVQKVAAGS